MRRAQNRYVVTLLLKEFGPSQPATRRVPILHRCALHGFDAPTLSRRPKSENGHKGHPAPRNIQMDEDRFNMAIRKFLKEVGVTSQREIEILAVAVG